MDRQMLGDTDAHIDATVSIGTMMMLKIVENGFLDWKIDIRMKNARNEIDFQDIILIIILDEGDKLLR